MKRNGYLWRLQVALKDPTKTLAEDIGEIKNRCRIEIIVVDEKMVCEDAACRN
jgi:hypothetical protein